jgi:predicted dehydrogenase
MKKHKIGIVGCGLIGNKRAKAISGQQLIMVADTNLELAKKLAKEYGCEYTDDYKNITSSPEIDIVIVSTPNNMLIPVALDAVKNNKNVLIEKPGARNPEEIKQLVDAVKGTNIKIKVGFNHRYHPAIVKAKEMLNNPSVGEIIFIRARYGHGGRIGYDKEWRAKKDISGGGELLDQGCHLIDLGRMFLGDFKDVFGYTAKYFWDMEVEDNGFALLKTKKGQIMQMHASWTEWKNLFSFEIMCKNAKLKISGLGKSYGVETLTYYQMKPEMGPPDKEVFTFEGEDKSWDIEFAQFLDAIDGDKKINDLQEAYETLKDIYKIYQLNNI